MLPTADLQFLVGEVFGQICLDPYSLQFRFAGGGQITVEGRIEHLDSGGLTHPYNCQDPDGQELDLHQLLQRTISAVRAEPLCLTLTFDDRAVLRIFTELGSFECGQIYPPDLSKRGLFVF
jgi:hypothetical protein